MSSGCYTGGVCTCMATMCLHRVPTWSHWYWCALSAPLSSPPLPSRLSDTASPASSTPLPQPPANTVVWRQKRVRPPPVARAGAGLALERMRRCVRGHVLGSPCGTAQPHTHPSLAASGNHLCRATSSPASSTTATAGSSPRLQALSIAALLLNPRAACPASHQTGWVDTQAGGGQVLKAWPQQPDDRTVHLVQQPGRESEGEQAERGGGWYDSPVSYQWLLDSAAACQLQPLHQYAV